MCVRAVKKCNGKGVKNEIAIYFKYRVDLDK